MGKKSLLKRYKIPLPFCMNLMKHDLGFIRSYSQYLAFYRNSYKNGSAWERHLEIFLRKTGNNNLDIYSGELSPNEITEYFGRFLKNRSLFDYEIYKDLIYGNSGFYTFFLSDGSSWIFKLGENPKRYIHIHPAKYVPFTLRTRAVLLKTVVLLRVFGFPIAEVSAENLNRLRKNYLGLPPISEKQLSGSRKLLTELDRVIFEG